MLRHHVKNVVLGCLYLCKRGSLLHVYALTSHTRAWCTAVIQARLLRGSPLRSNFPIPGSHEEAFTTREEHVSSLHITSSLQGQCSDSSFLRGNTELCTMLGMVTGHLFSISNLSMEFTLIARVCSFTATG